MDVLKCKTKIPFIDLKEQYRQIKQEVLQAIERVCDEAVFSGGSDIENFEKEFASYCNTQYAVAVNNGTSALHLSMVTLGIGKGDEVIVPANSFIATAWGVSYTGATPVFVDCTSDTWQIDPAQIESRITRQTKAIIGVHLYGQPFDVDAVKNVAARHKLFLVEDAAHAHGATYRNKRVGNFGDIACFSFYPTKNLGTYGEGGGLTTNNAEYYKNLLSLRNDGTTTRYHHDQLGYNMRMGAIEAAVLGVKMKYLDEWNIKRKNIANRYRNEISNPAIQLQRQPDFAESVHHLFVVTTPNRDAFMKYLNERNIFPGLHYPMPCHLQKAYQHLGYQKGDLPNAEHLSDHCLSLPMYAELNVEEVNYIIGVVNGYRD
jgi:dTDP-4-amino-4,6-dideoxygalactose transaminase